jgi:hypothetical protein
MRLQKTRRHYSLELSAPPEDIQLETHFLCGSLACTCLDCLEQLLNSDLPGDTAKIASPGQSKHAGMEIPVCKSTEGLTITRSSSITRPPTSQHQNSTQPSQLSLKLPIPHTPRSLTVYPSLYPQSPAIITSPLDRVRRTNATKIMPAVNDLADAAVVMLKICQSSVQMQSFVYWTVGG